MKKRRVRLPVMLVAAVCLAAILASGSGLAASAKSDARARPVGAAPSNDDFGTPVVISGLDYLGADLDISQATVDTEDPDPVLPCVSGSSQGYNTVWYRYTPSIDDLVVTFDTAYSNYDTVLAVWTGSAGFLTNVACNDEFMGTHQSLVTFEVTAGQTYHIEVASGAAGSGTLKLEGFGSLHTITGNTGVGGATLTYFDLTTKTVVSNTSGDYRITIPDGWTGIVTPSKTGCGFSPGTRTYTIPRHEDAADQNFISGGTLTFKSSGTYDGWILESSETSGVGGTRNAGAATFNLGDDAARKQYRAILSFDTSSLPDAATFSAVTLKIKKQSLVGTNPFSTLGSLLADIKKGAFGTSATLQLGDFKATASKNAVLSFPTSPNGTGWYWQNLGSGNSAYISKKGVTQFRLRFSVDDNNNAVADFLKFYSGNAASANRPQLVVTFSTLPY